MYASISSSTLISLKFTRLIPHSNPLLDFVTSSLKRLSEAISPSQTTTPSRISRAFACRRISAVGHAAAGDRADLRDLEDFLHERLAENDFLLDSVEHADHRGLDLFFDLVNDRVQANIDVFLFGDIGGTRLGPNVEADDNDRGRSVVGLRCRCEQNVGFGDRADAGTNNADLDLLGRKFFERAA